MDKPLISRKIAARTCTVKEIFVPQAENFLNEHHSSKTAIHEGGRAFGLFYNEELLGVALFSYPRTPLMKRKYSFELLRLAFKKNVQIIGGASKLLKCFINEVKPTDFFTYQDTTGEASEVYSLSGMTLVKENKTKRYLVAPDKTVQTGTRKEVLGLPYATRYGPDRILGTALGEVFRGDGTRKSNRELFLEDLGWHEEATSGDRVYEWVNPNYTFYTYKITASDSKKYYFGISHVKLANATIQDCLEDGYFGSGDPKQASNKYANWKKKHSETLQKEIVARFRLREEAYEAERILVGTLWADDPQCLNSTPGGRGFKVHTSLYSQNECVKHGLTTFQGNTCKKCSMQTAITMDKCPIHGSTIFWGGNCATCVSEKRISVKHCIKHGPSKHKGNTCYKCENEQVNTVKKCVLHGVASHQGDSCCKCLLDKRIKIKECLTHGLQKHQNDSCYLCMTEEKNTFQDCSIHGVTKFYGKTCAKCSVSSKYKRGVCIQHGEVTLRGSKCVKCSAALTAHTRFHKEKNTSCPHCINR